MRVEILLPTQYITSGGRLQNLDKTLVENAELFVVNTILSVEGGVTRSKVEGYYKSRQGIITKSKYISLVVYTSSPFLVSLLDRELPKVCVQLKQECIGVMLDNNIKFIN